MSALNIRGDVVELAAELINISSVSGQERAIADAVEAALVELPWLEVLRDGDAVVARTPVPTGTSAGAKNQDGRVILAGHLDTVPLPTTPNAVGTAPASWDAGGEILQGRGSVDMKGGVAVQLALAATLAEPSRQISYIFYDHEEVEAAKSGLGRLIRNHPEWVQGDFGILLEPTAGVIEGGCNGTARFEIRLHGKAAHSARAWMGHNAIHDAAEVLNRLRDYSPETIQVDGLEYPEGLNAVRISGGVAGNVIPDSAVVEINYRFAPNKSLDQAEAVVQELFTGFDVVRTDGASAARPGLDQPLAQELLGFIPGTPQAKYGWTDVARLAELGIPAVNYGPGDALLAHSDQEHVPVQEIRDCYQTLLNWLQG